MRFPARHCMALMLVFWGAGVLLPGTAHANTADCDRYRYNPKQKALCEADVLIDCDHPARHPVDEAICRDDTLSGLVREMRAALDETWYFIIPGDTLILEEQRKWRDGLRKACADAGDTAACVGKRFTEDQPVPDGPGRFHSLYDVDAYLRVNDIVPGYDLELSLEPPFGCVGVPSCENNRQLVFFPAGRPHSDGGADAIELPGLAFSVDEDSGDIWLNGETTYIHKDQARDIFQVGDYNFDGFDDVALPTGHRYVTGAQSHWVFLYDPEHSKAAEQPIFRFAPAMSELFGAMLVEIDAEGKELDVSNKSGCCLHYSTTYKVEHNMPVPVSHYSIFHSEDEEEIETYEEWHDGEWQVIQR